MRPSAFDVHPSDARFEQEVTHVGANTQRSGKGRRRTTEAETPSRPQRVVEYLILDIRTWVDHWSPKFVMEVYEGQPIMFEEMLAPEMEEAGKSNSKKAVVSNEGSARPAPV